MERGLGPRGRAACCSAGRPTIDAIFCGSDQIARGVVDALRDRGVRVPDDIAVVGFDNWEIIAAATRPPLTTIDMNLHELGRQAGLRLLDMIDGSAPHRGVERLPCSLVVRESCGAATGAAANVVQEHHDGAYAASGDHVRRRRASRPRHLPVPFTAVELADRLWAPRQRVRARADRAVPVRPDREDRHRSRRSTCT